MKTECDKCHYRFTLWVSINTVQFEDWKELRLCSYCSPTQITSKIEGE